MEMLVGGLALFFVFHSLPIASGVRAKLTSALGAGGYKGLFSLASLAGLVLIVVGYGAAREAGSPQIWDPPAGIRHLTMLLMLPVFVFLLAAYLPGRIKAALKHPMLVAVKLWALAHLLANGDLASVLLFGSFLAGAVVDRISVKRRPGLTVTVGRGKAANRNDAIAIVGGLGLYALFVFWLHTALIGVPVV